MYLLNVNWFLCVFNQIIIRRHNGKEKNRKMNFWQIGRSLSPAQKRHFTVQAGSFSKTQKGMLKLPFLIIFLCIPHGTKVLFCFGFF